MTAQPWEPRVAALEAAYTQVDRRLGDLHTDLLQLRSDFNERLGRVDGRIDRLEQKLDRHFLWLAGLVATSWLSTVGAVLLHR